MRRTDANGDTSTAYEVNFRCRIRSVVTDLLKMRDVIRIDEDVPNGNEIEFQVPPLEKEFNCANSTFLLIEPLYPRIDLASCTLSPITDVNRGDGRLMSSRASLAAAMIEAAMTRVEADQSCFLRSCSTVPNRGTRRNNNHDDCKGRFRSIHVLQAIPHTKPSEMAVIAIA